MTGPAGLAMPYDVMTFRASLTGEVPTKLAFQWTVTGGVIMGGQGTPELRARYIFVDSFRASVTVSGLPPECPDKATERLYMTGPEPVPEYLGETKNADYKIDQSLLLTIRESLESEGSSQLYVWVYFGSGERKFRKLKASLLSQLATTKIDPSRFTIMGSSERERGATFWRIPPGSGNPAP